MLKSKYPNEVQGFYEKRIVAVKITDPEGDYTHIMVIKRQTPL